MTPYVYMVNKAENRVQKVKVGFSWTLLLWTWLLALPLFLRRVYPWAFGILALMLLSYYAVSAYDYNKAFFYIKIQPYGILHSGYWLSSIKHWSGLATFVISVFLGIKGNEITGRYYLARGWTFAEPDAAEAQYARYRWNMPITR